MAKIVKYERAIEIFGEIVEADRAASQALPPEAYNLYEWLGEDSARCLTLEFFVNKEFPGGADDETYRSFFKDEWRKIADFCKCPEHYLTEGY